MFMIQTDDTTTDDGTVMSVEGMLVEQLKKQIADLEVQKQQLETQLKDASEIAKRSQYEYITLKTDFDSHLRRAKENEKEEKVNLLVDSVKKFLPFVESLRKSIMVIPDDQKDNPLAKGVIMTYEKFLSTLQSMGISTIQSLGLEPDSQLHEPVSVQPTDDEALKGKIVQEFEQGFVYEKDGVKKVISTSKVVVGE